MSSAPSHEVQFQPVGKRVNVPAETTLLDAARLAGIDITAACGGEGNCGQCQVVPLTGETTPLNSDEEFLISEKDRAQGYRLACCTKILSDVKVHLPKDSLITGQRLQVESNLRDYPPDPFFQTYPVEIPIPTLDDLRSDATRLVDALAEQHHLTATVEHLSVIRTLPTTLRATGWKATTFAQGTEILAVRPPGQSPLGFSVDLGTTKIAAFLVDLETGATLATGSSPNPQISYGEDVISRLNYAYRNPDGGPLLAQKVHQALDELLGDMLEQVDAERAQVVDACIVGNTAMTHLLLQLPIRQLAKAPYVAATSDALDVPATELGLGMAPGARVHIPATIGGFVGGDHVAMVLASDLDLSDKITLGLDIGTNTEISLRIPGQPHLTTLSCASGPAFEGAHIRDGMRAASGAIEKVRISEKGLELTTINDEPAVGLCGSGILDTIAELCRAGLLEPNGKLNRERPPVRVGDQGTEFLLVPGNRSGSGRDIVMTQKDINEIQLAKGAIHAGLNVLLEATGLPREAVQEVIVAGAFGSFLNIENAIRIGLFPDFPNAQYRQVGNAAALGAKWMLISREARARAVDIARNANYLELTTYPKFNRQFARAMMFPEK
ncbi:MAG: DUF4445 domain-containing protein [Anaerolineales bacterium]|nr:DUF4445 domain-containing protein [Anaerolineales bacterium]